MKEVIKLAAYAATCVGVSYLVGRISGEIMVRYARTIDEKARKTKE